MENGLLYPADNRHIEHEMTSATKNSSNYLAPFNFLEGKVPREQLSCLLMQRPLT